MFILFSLASPIFREILKLVHDTKCAITQGLRVICAAHQSILDLICCKVLLAEGGHASTKFPSIDSYIGSVIKRTALILEHILGTWIHTQNSAQRAGGSEARWMLSWVGLWSPSLPFYWPCCSQAPAGLAVVVTTAFGLWNFIAHIMQDPGIQQECIERSRMGLRSSNLWKVPRKRGNV